jgi:nitrogen fixation NifU-like protein
MLNSLYSEEVIKHFQDPHNMGFIKDADGIGEVGNPSCGDMMKLYIKVDKKDNKEYVSDIKFETMGCAAAIATSSMVTDLAKGKTIEEVLKITNKDVSHKLGGLPPIKEHCSNLAEEALKAAIDDYNKKKK